jgi:N-acetylneuraminic acid mutarotase
MAKRIGRLVVALILLLMVVAGGLYLALSLSPPTACPRTAAPLEAGSWGAGAPMPTDRSELAAAALGGKIYVGGGLRLTGASNAFEAYDPALDAWQELTPLPAPTHHFGMAAAGDRLILTGGFEGNSFSSATDGVWVYDPAEDSWTAGAPMPDSRAAHGSVTIDGLVYVVGGAGVGSTFLMVYDPAADAWETLPATLPTPREHLAAATVEGMLLVIGGRWPGEGNYDTVEIYDPVSGVWESGAPMPTARGGLTAAAVGNRVHVAGGEDFDSRPTCTYPQHEVYDLETDTWLTFPNLPTPRHGLTSAVVGEEWFVIGGGTKAAALTLVSSSDLIEIFRPW